MDSWGLLAYNYPKQRTVLAWKDGYAYLIITEESLSIPTLKECIEKLNLDPLNSIVLDGSDSTCMGVEIDGSIKNFGGNRRVYNMIRLTKSSEVQ